MITLALLVFTLLAPHPGSLSSSRVRVVDDTADVTLRVQVLSLLEVLPALDANADGTVTPAEVAAHDAEIFGYVSDHYTLAVGSARDHSGGEGLLAEYVSLTALRPDEVMASTGYRAGAVDVQLRYRHSAPIRDLLLTCTLFFDTSPDHIDTAQIQWADGTPQHFGLNAREPTARVDREGRGALLAYLRLGWEHILDGWDHLAFVALLVVSALSLRGLLAVITAFTLAHSITLAAVVLQWIDVSGVAHMVEPAIALSIAYVAAENLLQRTAPRSRWYEAFVFGLVHGLGFAAYLGRSLLEEPARGTALLGFNLGVELGQVLVGGALCLPLLLWARTRTASKHGVQGASGPGPARAPLAPWVVRAVTSGALLLAGMFWFFERL
ncbi:MAG: membrane protein [Planctomycetota bacterium]|nr:MAG: membrane protein [Planctomycetota bacterium]